MNARRCSHAPTDLAAPADSAVATASPGRGIARSNYSGLRYREPLYRSLRDLALSYFESYFNLRREKTLRRYSAPVDLSRFDGRGWMTAEDDLWDIPDYLANVRHFPLITSAQARALATVDRRMFAAGLVGRENGKKR